MWRVIMEKDSRRKKTAIILLSSLLLLSFMGCGSNGFSSGVMSNDFKGNAMDSAVSEESFSMSSGYNSNGNGNNVLLEEQKAVQTERKRIRTVDMTVETKEFEKLILSLEEQVKQAGGYIENRSVYNGSSYSQYQTARSADMKLRIPKEQLDNFLNMVEGIGNVISKEEREDDVTLEYVDLESHKQALQTEQKRLLELLEKAENIEDIIAIEQRLSDVRYQIESMESQLRTYDSKIDYSTVNLQIEEVKELTPVIEETAWERISNGFIESLKNIGHGAAEFAIWFLVHIPYLVIWAIVIGIFVVVLRKCIRKSEAKKKKYISNPYMPPMQGMQPPFSRQGVQPPFPMQIPPQGTNNLEKPSAKPEAETQMSEILETSETEKKTPETPEIKTPKETEIETKTPKKSETEIKTLKKPEKEIKTPENQKIEPKIIDNKAEVTAKKSEEKEE